METRQADLWLQSASQCMHTCHTESDSCEVWIFLLLWFWFPPIGLHTTERRYCRQLVVLYYQPKSRPPTLFCNQNWATFIFCNNIWLHAVAESPVINTRLDSRNAAVLRSMDGFASTVASLAISSLVLTFNDIMQKGVKYYHRWRITYSVKSGVSAF